MGVPWHQLVGLAPFRAELPDLTGLKRGPQIDSPIGITTGEIVVGSVGVYGDADPLISPALDQVRRRLSQSNNTGCPRRGRHGGIDLLNGA
jgi:hypothetical protein